MGSIGVWGLVSDDEVRSIAQNIQYVKIPGNMGRGKKSNLPTRISPRGGWKRRRVSIFVVHQ